MKLEKLQEAVELGKVLVEYRKIITSKSLAALEVTVNNHDAEVHHGDKRQTEKFWIMPSPGNWHALLLAEIADLEYKLKQLGVDV